MHGQQRPGRERRQIRQLRQHGPDVQQGSLSDAAAGMCRFWVPGHSGLPLPCARRQVRQEGLAQAVCCDEAQVQRTRSCDGLQAGSERRAGLLGSMYNWTLSRLMVSVLITATGSATAEGRLQGLRKPNRLTVQGARPSILEITGVFKDICNSKGGICEAHHLALQQEVRLAGQHALLHSSGKEQARRAADSSLIRLQRRQIARQQRHDVQARQLPRGRHVCRGVRVRQAVLQQGGRHLHRARGTCSCTAG